jgi:uncharacterized protein
MPAANRFADFWAPLWIGRKRFDRDKVENARAAVAHLKPIVVVTGGSRGIGAALAMRFAEAGNDVALVARNAGGLTDAARLISQKTHQRAIELVQDVTSANAPQDIEKGLAAQGFYIDVLINNAGVGLSGAFAQEKSDDIEGLIDLNIHALTRLSRHVLPSLRARRRGGILNVASLGGVVPGPYQAAYYASKAYVVSLTEAVAAETSGEGVRIAVLVPGPVNTSFHQDMGAEGARYRWALPAQTPESVANSAYRGFNLGQRVIIPGIFNRLAFVALRLLPHPVSVPLMAWLLALPSKPRD